MLHINLRQFEFNLGIILGCTANGGSGDGTTRGSCEENQVCLENGTCTESMWIANSIYRIF